MGGRFFFVSSAMILYPCVIKSPLLCSCCRVFSCCAVLPRRYNSAQRRPALPIYFVSDGLSPAVGRFRCCVVCAYLTALKRLLGRHCILSVSAHLLRNKYLKLQVLKSGECLYISILFCIFAISNKGELPFGRFG